MSEKRQPPGRTADIASWPEKFPTHRHSADFWEALGRAVATYGFLEEVLERAIGALTFSLKFPADTIEAELNKRFSWIERSLTDNLSRLVDKFIEAAGDHQRPHDADLDALSKRLRSAVKRRNALCHGSWQVPDANGRSALWYFEQGADKQPTPYDQLADVRSLNQEQRDVAEIAAAVINTVTERGYLFPGMSGEGEAIF